MNGCVDHKQLNAASEALAEAFHSQEFQIASNSKELKGLPPAVYADLVTRAAKNSPRYVSDEATMGILMSLSKDVGDDRYQALQNVMNIRLKGEVRKKSPFDSITNPK